MSISNNSSLFQTSSILFCLASVGILANDAAAQPQMQLAAANPNTPNASKKQRFSDIVGLNVKFSQGEPQEDIALLPELGVKWVRDNSYWHEMEPTPGRYIDFPTEFKKRLAFYKKHGIGVMYPLVYSNNRAYPDTPENPLNSINVPAFGRYAAQVARLLKAEGVKFHLEIWNEPHNFVLLKQVGGEWNAKPPSPWADHYVAMVHEAVRQVKAIDPNIQLMTDEDVWVNHYRFIEKGLPPALDGFAIHPYWGANSVGPEYTGLSDDIDWAKPFQLVDKDGSLSSAIRRLKEEGAKAMGKTPLIWATEIGRSVGTETPITPLTPAGKVTEEAQAAYLPRIMVTAASLGQVETVYWFSSYDGPDGSYGLRTIDGTRRKSYTAMKTMTEQLGEYTYAEHLVGKDHPATGVQAHLFSSPKGSKIVLWKIDGEGAYLAPKVQNSKLRIIDVMGKDVLPLITQEGRPYLKLSQSPIYVTGLPAKLTLETLVDGGLGAALAPPSLPLAPSPNDNSLPPNIGRNVALNCPVISSDPNVLGWDKGLTDGSWGTTSANTFATGDSQAFPKTATVDLGKSYNLGLIRLGVPAFGSTKTVQVSVSSDNQKFTEVGSHVFSQSKEERQIFTVKAPSARYLRITYPDHYTQEVNFPQNYAFTTELEAYAPTDVSALQK